MVRAKRIIADSIKDHLIHHISSLSSSKQMMDTLTRLFEGSNINQRMTLRSQLKNVKMQNSETIHSYFSRVNQIKEYCKEVGIKRELSTPYNPQQNGIAERTNRTIMEVVKGMIHDQDLPMHLWAEATKMTMYVQNKSSHKVLENKTLEEMFSGEKP
jgi:transposase InsO family protein